MTDDVGDYTPPVGTGVGLSFKAPAMPPAGDAVALGFKYIWYRPPAGNAVALDFSGAYSPPTGNAVAINFSNSDEEVGPKPEQYLFPAGWASSALGEHSISNWMQQAKPNGWEGVAWGTALIANKARLLQATGWGSLTFGASVIRNVSHGIFAQSIQAGARFGVTWASLWARTLLLKGWQSDLFGRAQIYNLKQEVGQAGNIAPRLAFGSAQIYNRNRTLKPEGVLGTVFGLAAISHTERKIQPGSILAPGFGTAWASFSPRKITPEGIYATRTGLPQVGGSRYLRPEGFDASRYGTRIIPESQSVYPQGMDTLWGTPLVRNARFVVKPQGFVPNGSESARFGTDAVFNARQYLHTFHDELSQAMGEAFGIWTEIKNRNRVVGAIGFDAALLPRPFIDNKARAVLPGGILASVFGLAFVAPAVRYVGPDAIDPPYIGPWNAVLNTARMLHPRGFATPAFGQHAIAKTRRYFERIGNWDSLAMGSPFVAFARREITFEPRYAIQPPVIPLPKVENRTRYVEAAGAGDQSGYGNAHLEIHWNKAYPRMGDMASYGTPSLRNVTPEVLAWGRNQQEFGSPTVLLYQQIVKPQGLDALNQGRPQIRDKRTWVYPQSQDLAVVSDKATVQNLRPDPPMTQWVFQLDVDGDQMRMGMPNLNQQVIYPISEKVMTLFGSTLVRQNVVQPVGIYDFFDTGTPFVSLRNRTLEPKGIASSLAFGKPRLNPHTIWASTQATAQAIENHDQISFYPVDFPPNVLPFQGMGSPAVHLKNRRITAVGGLAHTSFGGHEVRLKRHYISPTGWKLVRFGWPEVPAYVRYIRQFSSTDMSAFGLGEIKPAPYFGPQTVRPVGIAGEFGQARVEHLHRSLHLSGWDSMRLGASGESPRYMQQHLWVGAPDWPQMQGFDASVFGESWISLRVREVQPKGWDSFLMEYDLQNFDQRMRVRRPVPAARVLAPLGWAADRLGVGSVKLGQHFIRPDGNADMFRKGAW